MPQGTADGKRQRQTWDYIVANALKELVGELING